MKGTLHILCAPTKPVHDLNRVDPFSTAIIKFVENMQKLDWNCIVYTIPGSSVPCESVECLSFIHNTDSYNIEEYNRNAGQEIQIRKQPGDLIMCFHGWENQSAANQNKDLLIVEPSIGYDIKAIFAPYRAFTSYAQMHMYYGHKNMLMTPSWFDAVIPNAFSAHEFNFNENKDEYLLIFGRVVENKGIHIAIQAAEKTGHKLIIAGPGTLNDLGYNEIPQHVEYVGICNVEQRRQLMSNAKAILGPTYYVEPFGNMIVESYFSGTPAITTDWGGFVDTVQHGVTGFRCKEFREFTEAINNIDTIKPADCLDFAMKNYEESVVHQKFDQYFLKLKEANFYRL